MGQNCQKIDYKGQSIMFENILDSLQPCVFLSLFLSVCFASLFIYIVDNGQLELANAHVVQEVGDVSFEVFPLFLLALFGLFLGCLVKGDGDNGEVVVDCVTLTQVLIFS